MNFLKATFEGVRMKSFKLRQLVKLAELDEEFVNGVVVGLPTKRWPYYEVNFLRWDGSSESMWLTENEMISADMDFAELDAIHVAA
jgi:hypothetical protein